MRPLKLLMAAFGPYAKEQIIDFTELGGRNLFVITGDTGAGKTTVLDAISYALYGKASGRDRDNESLRSHFASDDVLTVVELDFEIAGQRYWIKRIPKQRKAKSRGTGWTEQNAEAELKIVTEDTNLIAGVTEVNSKIVQLMGLTYDQFKQIIMIPQGEFRELLTADSKSRQDILQKIFGTEVLRRIQELLEGKASSLLRGISELYGQRNELIRSVDSGEDDVLRATLVSEPCNVSLLITELKQSLTADSVMSGELQERCLEKDKQLFAKQAEIFQGQAINQKLLECDTLQKKKQRIESRQSEMADRQTLLQNARRARMLQSVDEDCHNRERIVSDKQLQLEQAVMGLKTDKLAVDKALLAYQGEQAKEEQRNQLFTEQNRLTGLSTKVADWDVNIQNSVQLEKHLVAVQAEKTAVETMLKTVRSEIVLAQDELNKAKSAAVDFERLSREMDQITIRNAKIQALQEENDKLAGLRQSYLDLQRDETRLHKQYEQAQQSYEQDQRAFVAGQAGYLAAQLVAGQACPVCGSTEHVHPADFQTDIPNEAALTTCKKAELQAREGWEKANKDFQLINTQGATQKEIVLRLQQEVASLVTENIAALEKEQLTRYIAEQRSLGEQKSHSLRVNLSEASKLKESEKKFNDLLTAKNQRFSELEQRFTVLTSQYTTAFSSLNSLKNLIKVLMGEIAPEIRSTDKLQKAIKQVKTQFELLKQQLELSEKRLTDSKVNYAQALTRKENAEKTLGEAQSEFEKSRQRFRQALTDNEFVTKAEYEAAKMDDNSLQQLDAEIVAYFEALRSIRDQFNQAQQQVTGLKAIVIDTLAAEFKSIQSEKDLLLEQRTTVLSRISHNQTLLDRICLLSSQLEQQEEEHKLIGHLAKIAKGDNEQKVSFERYVLAAFFNDIIQAANKRLDTMTSGRYRMNRMVEKGKGSGQSGLEIEVFDYYTGQSRHVKTLSGGESFKASLALALGLAEVVQHYAGGVSLETMFVDEGFGTLDSESLDQAINCLIDLQHSGRLVGIISHVPELRASVEARLEIEAGKDGSSAHFCVM